MGFTERVLDYSIRSIIKPYLRRMPLDEANVGRLRYWAERSLCTFLRPPAFDVKVSQCNLAGMPVEEITPANSHVRGTLLYCPGGGYLCCSPKTHRNLTVRLAHALKVRVIVLDYPKLPEVSVLKTIEQTQKLYVELSACHLSKNLPIVIGGDSAGAHLAISMILNLKQECVKTPDGLFCLSPWTDMNCPREGRFYLDWDPLIPVTTLEQVGALCLDGAFPYDERYSPVYADLSCLPPTLIQAVATEILYHDATRFTARAHEFDRQVYLSTWYDVPHCFQLCAPFLADAVHAFDEIVCFCDRFLLARA